MEFMILIVPIVALWALMGVSTAGEWLRSHRPLSRLQRLLECRRSYRRLRELGLKY